MNLTKLSAIAFIVLAPSLAFAGDPEKIGPNGGPQKGLGDYHVEILPKEMTLQVFLRDHSDKPVSSAGFKGTAIFAVGGKSQRIALSPAGDNKLSGTSPVSLPASPTGVVQITSPAGKTAQTKF